MTRLPAVNEARSSSVTKTCGAVGSCSTQFTMMSLSASSSATGSRPSSVSTQMRSGLSGSAPICSICTDGIGAATAATSRLVSPRTSSTPCAFKPVTAPRAVAPKPSTVARSRRP